MKKGTQLKRWIAVLCAMILTVSLFAIPAFADETESTSEVDSTEESTEAATESDSESESDSETESASESASESESESESTADTSEEEKDEGGKKLSTHTIVWLIVAGVAVIAGVVLGIKFREKIKKSLRVYKSEAKKIVWLPWDQTKKNTVVVIIVLVICAAAICLLDYVLYKGIFAFIDLF